MGKKNKKKEFEFPLIDESEIGNEHDIKCAAYRGKVIHYMINIETTTESIIQVYYFGIPRKDSSRDRLNEFMRKQQEFVSSVISKDRFSFMFKFEILTFILKNHYKDFLKEHDYFLKTFEELINFRNKFAHYNYINYSLPLNPNRIALLYPTTTRSEVAFTTVDVTDKFMKEFFGKYQVLRKDLKEIESDITKRAITESPDSVRQK